MAWADEKYILFTTFRRDGTPVSTPVWIVPIDDTTFGFWTSSGSGKAKRLAHTSRVTIQPCNGRGTVRSGTHPVEATAQLVTGEQLRTIRTKIVSKYGVMTKVAKLMGSLIGAIRGKRIPYGDRGVVVSIS